MNDEEEKQAMAQRIKELENELAVLREASPDSETPSTCTGGTSGASALPMRQAPVIYVQQDRKLPLFSGKLDGNESLTLDEWIEQIRLFAQTRGATEKERPQIVFDHL
ncbi:unnamed protein product [Knipowitschia caucasica]|uniref:Uncharacterized protein n=1 Tax=Knipowitschia caucasica TaxID=637954 RepID=A0AAV2K7F0_KNICA